MIAAIILAAGESTRMGRLKQLLPWDGEPLIAWQVRQMLEAGVEDVVVVLGHAVDEIRPAVPETARVVVNEAYRDGRATSLRAGAMALPDDTDAVLILNVDQPRPAWVSRRVLERWRRDRPAIVQPRFGGRAGHPVLVDASLVAELRAVEEATLGLRAVMERHASTTAEIVFENTRIDVDLNTPEDYEAALSAYLRGDWGRD